MSAPSSTPDKLPVPDRAAAYRLYQGGIGALVIVTGYFLWKSGGDIGLDYLLGLAILYVACVPALLWAKNNRAWFPAFEISHLACVAFYSVPILIGHSELQIYTSGVVAESATLVLLYLIVANLAFLSRRVPLRVPRWAEDSLLPESALNYIPVGLFLNSVYLYVDVFTDLIPFDFQGLLRALFFGMGTVGTFILARLWGLGQLTQNTRIFFVFNVVVQVVLLFSQLYLIRAISLIALGLIAYSSGRRRIPWIVLLIMVPTLAILHRGKADMREIYWDESPRVLTVTGLPAYFIEWFGYGLEAETESSEQEEKNRGSLLERASLIQMLCLSVDGVPETRPYLYGESYVDIPALAVPRFLWPKKPSSLMANIRLAVHFDLVDPESYFKYSIAFGMIAEAYLNFGYFGPPLLGLLFGLALKRITTLSENAPEFSALGLSMILLTAWSFQAELVLATWLSSLFQAAVICVGLPLVYRRFTTN